MKKLITSIVGLTLMCALSAFAGTTKEEIVGAKGTFAGTLKHKDGAAWACTATVKGDGVVHVKWASNEVTYNGKMGPAGGKAGAPLTMNGSGADKSEVRFMWKSATELQVEWWPTST